MFYSFDFSKLVFIRTFFFFNGVQEVIQLKTLKKAKKKWIKQRKFVIIIYSSWSAFLILIPSIGIWKAELTDRMTEHTQTS